MLKTKQVKTINVLLNSRTVEDAACQVRVTPRTIRNWLKDPEFALALRDAENALTDETRRRLAAGRTKAVDVLEDLLKSKNEPTRRLVAGDWLKLDLEYTDRDTERRLTELERRVYGHE